MEAWLDISEEMNFNMWLRDCSCNILEKNVAVFCPHMKSLTEAKVKKFILITLTKKSQKSLSRDLVFWSSLVKCVLNNCYKLRK